jgi:hypothetical protein
MYGSLRIRTDFVRWLALAWARRSPGPSCYGLRVERTGPGGLSARRIVCHFMPRHASAREIPTGGQESTCRTAGSVGRSNRDIGGSGRLNDGAPSDALLPG